MKNDDPFPKLTILPDSPPPPAQPRLTTAQKYGSLYWLGISGLVFSIGLVGWFAWSLVAMRQVWQAVYVLHDTEASAPDREAAVFVLLTDPRVQAQQIQPMLFRPTLPDKARYLLAESLDKAVSATDARQMLRLLATSNAASPPNWLRSHLARLAAVTIPKDAKFPADSFRQLLDDSDPIVADWAAFALSGSPDETQKSAGTARLKKRAEEGSQLAATLMSIGNGPDRPTDLAPVKKLMRIETEANRALFAD
jgi:hypothetical protein